MPATETLFGEFPPVSTAEWQAAVVKDLKGKDPSTLLWKSEDGITIKPFYRAEDVPEPLVIPGLPRAGWKIGVDISAATPAEANSLARRAVEHGAQEIVFTNVKLASGGDVRDLLAGLSVPVNFRYGDDAGRVLRLINDSGIAGLRGSIDYDPVCAGEPVDGALVNVARQKFPEFCPVAVRADGFHEAGATSVEELGFAMASGVEYLNQLGGGMAHAIVFVFATGSNYFFEIAKLRAARILWAQVQDAFGVAVKMNLYARTANWDATVYDPYNNLLRGTTEAMSAAIGGADVINVLPFNECYRDPDDFSRHLALNTQLILREEAHFDKVADPAAGSWYVDWLTRALAEAAWNLLQKVEAEGGLTSAIGNGFVEKTIGVSRANREKLVAQRRRVLVGTNQYPNLRETMLDQIEKELSPRRGGYPFEQVRLATERYAQKAGAAPKVLLLALGDLKMRRARADFITNFFGIGGFSIAEPPAFASAEAAADYAAHSGADIIVLCSSDPEYPAAAQTVIPRLRAAGENIPVLVAGYPQDALEQLKAAGVEDFIHIKSNVLETLSSWQRRLGVIA